MYSSLMEACRKLGRCEQALALLEEMRANGVVANAMVYDPLIRALRSAGEIAQATDVYRIACVEGVYTPRGEGDEHTDPRIVDLHGLRPDVACIAVSEVLDELRRAHYGGRATSTPEQRDRRRPARSSPDDLVIITGRGKGSKYLTPGGEPVIKVAIVEMLSLPEYAALEATEAEGNPGCLTVKATSLRAWLTEQQQEASTRLRGVRRRQIQMMAARRAPRREGICAERALPRSRRRPSGKHKGSVRYLALEPR